MNFRYYTIVLLMFCVSVAYAQKREKVEVKQDTQLLADTVLINAYLDSLQLVGQIFTDSVKTYYADEYKNSR